MYNYYGLLFTYLYIYLFIHKVKILNFIENMYVRKISI